MSWQATYLSDVAHIFNGKTPSKSEQRRTGHPVLKIKDIDENGSFKGNFESFVDKELSDKFDTKKLIQDDSLILNAAHNSDYVGSKQYRAEHNVIGALPTGEWLIARAKQEKMEPRFLNYWLSNPETKFKIKHFVKGIHLYPKDVARLEISFPPLAEQKRIAAILDKADDILRKRQQAIQLADDFLRAAFLDMFGDPFTNPKRWPVKPLKEQIIHANNGLSRRRKESENVGEIVLRLQDVRYDGIRFDNNLNRILLNESEKKRFLVDAGDILFIRVNGNPDYVGRSSVFEGYKEAVYHNDHLIRIKIGEAYEPRFLTYCFNHEGGRKIISEQIKTSAGQHTISQGGIQLLNFYLPPISMQQKFISIQDAIKKLSYTEDLPKKLFSSLSQKAFSGDLG